eukprot:1444184-Karenia_brevis.AAC.1
MGWVIQWIDQGCSLLEWEALLIIREIIILPFGVGGAWLLPASHDPQLRCWLLSGPVPEWVRIGKSFPLPGWLVPLAQSLPVDLPLPHW